MEERRYETDMKCVLKWLKLDNNSQQYSSPSSKGAPGGNTGEIKAAREGTDHPTSHADG